MPRPTLSGPRASSRAVAVALALLLTVVFMAASVSAATAKSVPEGPQVEALEVPEEPRAGSPEIAEAAEVEALTDYPPNYNPMLVISDFNWRNSASMSQSEIQAFLNSKPTVLKNYVCAEGGPNGLHSTVMKPAAQIIAEAAQYWNVNPKLILATLEKEQSLISQGWHASTPTHLYGTDYHLTNAMGCGVYPGSPDRHPGFGDQVWTGTQKLGQLTGPYEWYPGKTKVVYSYDHKAYITIAPLNHPTWNLYTYTPYYPQWSIWKIYNNFFGDPRIDDVAGRIHRFYNRKNGSHFYTASAQEAQKVARTLADTFTFEGPAYSLDTTSGANAAPLYRFYRKGNNTHFYTASEEERVSVIVNHSRTYAYEGPAYLVSTDAKRSPVYRFFNRQLASHFYTISPAERDAITANLGWKYQYEGVAYWVALSQ